MSRQLTSHILMIRPVAFGFNEETAADNHFQKKEFVISESEIQKRAAEEFDQFVAVLRNHGVRVTVVDDTLEPGTPDSIFPNNWVSFHEDGSTVLYPMLTPNRRAERRIDILEELGRDTSKISNISENELSGKILEGTGSMVLDRENRVAYASISERTNEELVQTWCEQFGFEPCLFHSTQLLQGTEKPIYHTNVIMCVGEELVVICSDVIRDVEERNVVLNQIAANGKRIIEISEGQMNSFAGNILQLRNEHGQRLMIMSSQAFKSSKEVQLKEIERSNTIVHSSLKTIETLGGGSARCMMAEVF